MDQEVSRVRLPVTARLSNDSRQVVYTLVLLPVPTQIGRTTSRRPAMHCGWEGNHGFGMTVTCLFSLSCNCVLTVVKYTDILCYVIDHTLQTALVYQRAGSRSTGKGDKRFAYQCSFLSGSAEYRSSLYRCIARNAVVSCAIIACNALQFLHAIICRLSNALKNIHEAKLLQPITAFGGIT